MCQFSELKAFTLAVKELNDCIYQDDKDLVTEQMLKSLWKDFSFDLSIWISEQDTHEKLSIFFKIAQNNLTEFADDLYYFYERNKSEGKLKSLYRSIIMDAIEILGCHKANYPEYFNLEATVPIGVICFHEYLNPAQKMLMNAVEKLDIDDKLLEVIDDYTKRLYLFNSYYTVSWHQYSYLMDVSEKLILFSQSKSNEDNTLRLIKLLIGYNFNPIEFYEYLIDYTERLINPDQSYEAQELELMYLLKSVKSIRQESNAAYNISAPPILISFGDYIERELDMITKMKTVNAPEVVNGEGNKGSDYYFEVSVTLEELFFLIRTMLEVRFIRTKFKSNLYTFVSRHIRTDRTKSPSEQYMRNIFGPNRQVSVKVIRKVRGWLMTMVNYIDSHFSDQLKFSVCFTLALSVLRIIQISADSLLT